MAKGIDYVTTCNRCKKIAECRRYFNHDTGEEWAFCYPCSNSMIQAFIEEARESDELAFSH